MHPSLPYWRLSGYYFFHFAFVGVFQPYFGLYLQSLGLSSWEIGLILSQMALMRLCSPAVWGWLADHLHVRIPLVRLAAGVSVVVFNLFFFAQTLVPLLGAMALLAFFWSAALPLMETVVFDHLHAEPARYSRVRIWGSIGYIVTVLATGALLDYLPPASVLWMSFVLMGGILAFALLVPESPTPPQHVATPPVSTILAQPRVRALLGACFLMSAAHGALYLFYSIYLADHGYSKTLVGSLWFLGVIAEIGVFFFMARLLRRFSLRQVLLASFAAAVLRFLLIGWGVDSLSVLLGAQLLHGLTFGAYHAAAIAAINRWFPGRCQARGQALYSSLSFGAGGLLGGLVSGWTWDGLGNAATFGIGALFAVCGLVLVAGWVRDESAPAAPVR
ncbi:MFS transporter [Azospira sp. I09]|uniref:MFS transporter n=1 Tax=Azospira sp. I09 TaxID=1765049 RepID=UPI0012610255|nr:MFS transporter [Azospira sp. I09]BBN87127.1 MFS transporter [Azospira sp. I09]